MQVSAALPLLYVSFVIPGTPWMSVLLSKLGA